jgi:hypothetical protein
MDGKPDAEDSGSFNDLTEDWYKNAVNWAVANGVTAGKGNKKFAPDDPLTREQIAVMLKAYAEKKGYDTLKGKSLNTFPDGSAVSSWAEEAMEWATVVGIINGKKVNGENVLAPSAQATRAEFATMVKGFNENVAVTEEVDTSTVVGVYDGVWSKFYDNDTDAQFDWGGKYYAAPNKVLLVLNEDGTGEFRNLTRNTKESVTYSYDELQDAYDVNAETKPKIYSVPSTIQDMKFTGTKLVEGTAIREQQSNFKKTDKKSEITFTKRPDKEAKGFDENVVGIYEGTWSKIYLSDTDAQFDWGGKYYATQEMLLQLKDDGTGVLRNLTKNIETPITYTYDEVQDAYDVNTTENLKYSTTLPSTIQDMKFTGTRLVKGTAMREQQSNYKLTDALHSEITFKKR